MGTKLFLYLLWCIFTSCFNACPLDEISGDPYKYYDTAAKLNRPCPPGTKFSKKACACVLATNDPRVPQKQATNSHKEHHLGSNVHNKGSDVRSDSRGSVHLFSSMGTGNEGQGTGHLFSRSFVGSGNHGIFLTSNQKAHTSRLYNPKQGLTNGGFVSHHFTDNLFNPTGNSHFPDSNQDLFTPNHFDNPTHSISQSNALSQNHIDSNSGFNTHQSQSFVNTLSSVPRTSQELINWQPFQSVFPSDANHGVNPTGPGRVPPPPPPKSIEHRLYIDKEKLTSSHADRVPPPPPPKSIEHRLYIDKEKLTPSHADHYRPELTHIRTTQQKPVDQHTLNLIKAWFSGWKIPSNTNYENHNVPNTASVFTNQDRVVDKKQHNLANNFPANIDDLFNLPQGGNKIRNPHNPPNQFPANTDDLFNLPPVNHGGNINKKPYNPASKFPANTDDLFNVPFVDQTSKAKDSHNPHTIPTNTDDLFNVPFVDITSNIGKDTHNPSNKIPTNTDALFNFPPTDQGGSHGKSFGVNEIVPVGDTKPVVSQKPNKSVNPNPNQLDLLNINDLFLPPADLVTSGESLGVNDFVPVGDTTSVDTQKPNKPVILNPNPIDLPNTNNLFIPPANLETNSESFGLNEIVPVDEKKPVDNTHKPSKLVDQNQNPHIPRTNDLFNLPPANLGSNGETFGLNEINPVGGMNPVGETFGLNEINPVGGMNPVDTRTPINPATHNENLPFDITHLDSFLNNLGTPGQIDQTLPDESNLSNNVVPTGISDTGFPVDQQGSLEPRNTNVDLGVDQHRPATAHINPNEFVPLDNTLSLPESTSNSFSDQPLGSSEDPLAELGDVQDILNLLDGMDLETFLQTNGVPVDQINPLALKMFQRRINQANTEPKQNANLVKLIKPKARPSAPVATKDNLEQAVPTSVVIVEPITTTVAPTEREQRLRKQKEKQAAREAQRLARKQARAALIAKAKARRIAQRKEIQAQRQLQRKQRQEARRLAREKAKAARKARQEAKRKARQEQKQHQQNVRAAKKLQKTM